MTNRLVKSWLVAALSVAFLIQTNDLLAQAGGGGGRNRGNRGQPQDQQQGQQRNQRDPAQFQAQRMDRYRQQLEVTNDDEWKLIQQRIEKVQQAQRETRMSGFGGFGGGQRGGGNNGPQPDNANSGRGNRGDRPGSETNPDLDALQKAVDAKAPASELKPKLAKVMETIKLKQANLVKAQDELRQVLTVRQESIALLIGLLR